jgi:hypothetical protein
LRSRQAFANVGGVNVSPVLALAGLAVIGLLAPRLEWPRWRHGASVALVLGAGVPLVLLGVVLGPGIEFVSTRTLEALAPVTALAVGWIGAALGARFEWRQVRRLPRGAWLAALVPAGAAFLVVAAALGLAVRLVPSLVAAGPARLPTIVTLAALAAASGAGVVALTARLVGITGPPLRAFTRAANVETAAAALALSVALALHRTHPPAGSAALGWLAWSAAALAAGALAGLVFLALARGGPRPPDLGFLLLGVLVLGAGIGYAADLSPFIVCAVAAALIVNATPERRVVRRLLVAGAGPLAVAFLVLLGASLALPGRAWLAVVPLLAALRIAGKWAGAYAGRAAWRRTALPWDAGLGTVAQGSAVLALGVSYRLTYGFLNEASGAVLTIVVGGVLLAQLAAPPLLRLAAPATSVPLTPARALPELSPDAAAERSG